MSDLLTLHEQAAALLTAKTSFAGITVTPLDTLEIKDTVDAALQKPRGLAVIIGTVTGDNPQPDVQAANFNVQMKVEIRENIRWNRRRTTAATAANQAARLALAGTVAIGEQVGQTDTGEYWWLFQNTGASASDWALVQTCSEIMQLVIRSLHHWNPAEYQTVTASGFNHKQDLERAVIEVFFGTRIFLDPQPVP